uniref:ZMYM2-like/QRICH1 C-terminal domain-containing protein n=1 Tax=Amphimedon queenslandica TaxID=400682 RepID=A0A1X7V9A0_AMPQE
MYKDQQFALFRSTYYSVLRDQHSKGVGAAKKQAEVITFDLEEELWSHGVLGNSDPYKLLDTLVLLLGVNFALRSGKEHWSFRPDMIEFIEKEDESSYLQYIEPGSKNNPGGLNERKLKNKSVKASQNLENPSRCIVKLQEVYGIKTTISTK